MLQLKQIHAHTLRNRLDFTRFLVTKLVEIPNIPYARKLFDLIPEPNLFFYNKLIQAYSSHGPYYECLSLYKQMCLQGCSPNQYSFTFLFAACAYLSYPSHGQVLHSHFLKLGLEFDLYGLTSLVDMYCKLSMMESARRQFNEMEVKDVPTWNSIIAGYSRSGDMDEALRLFLAIPSRTVISWTTMVSGYSQNGQYAKALDMFLEMEKVIKPNEVTISSVLPAIANLGALEVGQRIEFYARDKGYLKNLYVSNSILEMYSRCGRIDIAKRIFKEIGGKRDICSWNTMIMGLAVHGQHVEAFQLFQEMLSEGTYPDDVTFVGVLSACTHGGMVAEGRNLFQSMDAKFSLLPKLEHYGCMADLLGRSGELQEAYGLIQSMPMEPDSVIWGTLLGACSFYRDVELAEKAVDHLSVLEPWNPGNYVILSNVYASAGRWDGVARLRKLMKSGRMVKAAGYSLIEQGGQVYKFVVGDKSHPRSEEIYAVLDEVSAKLKLLRNLYVLDCLIEEPCIVQQ